MENPKCFTARIKQEPSLVQKGILSPLKFQDFPVPLVRLLMFPARHPKSFEEASCFYPSPQNIRNKQTPFKLPDGTQNRYKTRNVKV